MSTNNPNAVIGANGQRPLVAARCSTTPEQWWAKRASELAQQMKQGGVAELRLTRLPNGKYEFEITPEEWSNDKLTP